MDACARCPPLSRRGRRAVSWQALLPILVILSWQWLAASAVVALPRLDIGTLSHQPLLAPVEFLIADPHDDFETVRRSKAFRPLQPQHINQGVSDRAAWLRVRLDNPGAVEQGWVVQYATSYLDNFSVYYADNGGDYQELHLSDRRVFSDRAIHYRILAFHHVTPAKGSTDLYLRLNFTKPDSLILAVDLWDAQRFQQSRARINLLQGAYFGMMLAFISVTVVCALMLRQRLYIYYAAFLLCNTLLWAAVNGYAFQYLWPRLPYLHNEGMHIIFLLMTLAACQFSRELLSTRELFPRTDRIMSRLQWAMLAAIGVRMLGAYTPVLIAAFVSLASLGLLPVLGWLAYRKGVVHARWYTGAWLIYGGCAALSVMSASGMIPGWGMKVLIYTQAVSLLESLLLLVALGERLLRWDQERKTALDLAHCDPLTGLGNRRRLAQAFGELAAMSSRHGEGLFLALIDLDGFKPINDTHGHEAGDEVLKDLAELMRRHTRADDVCIRYGGEEFVVLLGAPSLEDARQIIERIRHEFELAPSRYHNRMIPHTLSAGLVGMSVTDRRAERSLEELIAIADTALYQAKAGGRNRIEVLEA